jgi:hypothetical protein
MQHTVNIGQIGDCVNAPDKQSFKRDMEVIAELLKPNNAKFFADFLRKHGEIEGNKILTTATCNPLVKMYLK